MPNDTPNHVTIKKLKDLGCEVKINHYRYFENKDKVFGHKVGPFTRKEINKGVSCDWENPIYLKWKDILPRKGITKIQIELPNQTISKDAVCSEKDNFNKKLGLKIALNRALNSVISEDGTLLSDFVNSKTTDANSNVVMAKL